MSTRRRYCRVAVLGKKYQCLNHVSFIRNSILDNCIYALGGFDSSNYQSSGERFDPRVGTWHSMPSMGSR